MTRFNAPINACCVGETDCDIEHGVIKATIDLSIVMRGVKNSCIPTSANWRRGNTGILSFLTQSQVVKLSFGRKFHAAPETDWQCRFIRWELAVYA
jgi:hypothetical protein